MNITTAIALATLALPTAAPHLPSPKKTTTFVHKVKKKRAKVWSAESTSYCLSGRMADGSFVRNHSIAMNRHPLGTKIRLLKPKTFNGFKTFVVRDRYGWGTELDFWSPSCAYTNQWGRRTVKYTIIK